MFEPVRLVPRFDVELPVVHEGYLDQGPEAVRTRVWLLGLPQPVDEIAKEEI